MGHMGANRKSPKNAAWEMLSQIDSVVQVLR